MRKDCLNKLSLFIFLVCICVGVNAQIPERPELWLMIEKDAVDLGQEFAISVHLNTLSQKVAAYAFNVIYDPSVLQYVGTSSGPDGFATIIVNSNTPGSITLSGFDVNGKGPGPNLNIVYFRFSALKYGASTVRLETTGLTDLQTSPIAVLTPNTTIIVKVIDTSLNYGDVNNDKSNTIVDALAVAQYAAGLITNVPNLSAGDVNGDFTINIIDAMLIAQRSAGLFYNFPVHDMFMKVNKEIVPIYPDGIPPAVINLANRTLSVKMRDARGLPVTSQSIPQSIKFSGTILPGTTEEQLDAEGLSTVVVPIEGNSDELISIIDLEYSYYAMQKVSATMAVHVHSLPVIPEPYYLSPSEVNLVDIYGSGGMPTKNVQVTITLPDSCKTMSLWGTLTRDGNQYTVDTTSYQFTDASACTATITSVPHIYYTKFSTTGSGCAYLVFKNWGNVIKTLGFCVNY